MNEVSPAFRAALPFIHAWLAGCRHHSDDDLAFAYDYALWDYQRDALGHGTLELINNPQLSIAPDLLSLSLDLDLPPIRTVQDAYGLFVAVDALDGAAVVCKDDEVGTLSVQVRVPLTELTNDTLPTLYRRLAAAKRYLEEP